MTGTVFDIKEFAVFDGPGIRTTVFMKGCPLRCSWCHNPEGLSPRPELMVSVAACVHCGACAGHCQGDTCNACGACVPYCKQNLRKIAGNVWTSEALASHIKRGAKLLAQSGGGVTFSGGEPLMQWPFVKETIGQLGGLHTAIETSGFCSDEVFLDVIETLDFIMMDVKLIDAALHKMYCGVDNAPILKHARMLADSGTPYVLRVPLIPGVNDNLDHLTGVARLAENAPSLKRVELLPYHKTAGAKYEMLSMKYAPGFDTERAVQALLTPFTERSIDVRVL